MATTIETADIEEIERNFIELLDPQALFDSVSGGVAIQFVAGFVFILGFIIASKGIMQLAANSQDNRQGYTMPLMAILTGVLLMYSLVLLKTGLTTVYGTGFDDVDTVDVINNSDRLLNIVIMIIQFIGVIGFIKGILLLKQIGQGQSGQGAGAKAFTFMLGGMLATNILLTADIILRLFGLELSVT